MPLLKPPRGGSRPLPENLFRPRSIAVIGADQPDGARILARMAEGGFTGPILATRVASPPAGIIGAASIAALPQAPDLAVLSCKPDEIAASLTALGRLGTTAAIINTRAPDIAPIRAAARAAGVRVLGPGSFGIAVPSIGLLAADAHMVPQRGRLALVSQSSTLCRAVLDWAEPNGVGFSHIVDIGGNCDIGYTVVLDWLSRDQDTGAILLDIRRIKDRRAFLSAARAAARLRPVLAIRAGSRLRDAGGEAEAVFAAALRRAGVLYLSGLDDLLSAAETLSRARKFRGDSVAIVCNAAGAGYMAADAALRAGLHLADVDEAAHQALRLANAEQVEHSHIFVVPPHEPFRLAEVAAMLAGLPQVSGVLVIHAPSGPEDDAATEALAACAKAIKQPLLVCAMGQATAGARRRRLAEAGLPVFASPELAVRGFEHMVRQNQARIAAQELPGRTVVNITPERHVVAAAIAAADRSGSRRIAAGAALEMLAAYGIASLRPGKPLPPAEGLRELAIRVAEDAVFGPVLSIGPGGLTDLSPDDCGYDLPPLNLPLAHALLARHPASRLLAEHRGWAPADREALARTLVRVSQMVVDFPRLAGLEINPLLVLPSGCLAREASFDLRAPGEAGKLALPPYPEELAEHWTGKGETVLIRPIRPEDAEAHGALFRRLTAEDIRRRFFSPMRELSAEQMARLTQIDYDREMAFIAVRPATGETVGVARLVSEPPGDSGEFAIIVQPDMKGTGVARRMMERLIDWGRAQGMREIIGQVLAENAPMIAFVRKLGFTIHRVPGESDIVEARLHLAAPG